MKQETSNILYNITSVLYHFIILNINHVIHVSDKSLHTKFYNTIYHFHYFKCFYFFFLQTNYFK